MVSATGTESAFEACDRFFSIPELFNIFLEQASPQVLLSCQRVCRRWNDEITSSQRLQENLFFSPLESNQDEVRINPILLSHFSPILAPSLSSHAGECDERHDNEEVAASLERGQNCSSKHLAVLPWARDGRTSLTSPSRIAFCRPEASWRNMLVSQPPIRRLDWWHEWIEARSVTLDPDNGDWEVHSRSRGDVEVERGWGHQDSNDVNVTIGMLWDLVEGRIVRGCWARVMFFPRGKDVERQGSQVLNADCDGTATRIEREWVQDEHSQMRGWTASMPRVKILTGQVWQEVPGEPIGFDMESRRWRALPESQRRDYAGDGFNALREDCRFERENAERWSKSEAFMCSEIDGESSGGY